MSMHKDEVNALIAELVDIKADTEKFDKGSEAAGRRARVALTNVSKRCREVKKWMLATSKERRKAKK